MKSNTAHMCNAQGKLVCGNLERPSLRTKRATATVLPGPRRGSCTLTHPQPTPQMPIQVLLLLGWGIRSECLSVRKAKPAVIVAVIRASKVTMIIVKGTLAAAPPTTRGVLDASCAGQCCQRGNDRTRGIKSATCRPPPRRRPGRHSRVAMRYATTYKICPTHHAD